MIEVTLRDRNIVTSEFYCLNTRISIVLRCHFPGLIIYTDIFFFYSVGTRFLVLTYGYLRVRVYIFVFISCLSNYINRNEYSRIVF